MIRPEDDRQYPLRMLFGPVGVDLFEHACEADGFRGLVAALMRDADYESIVLAKDRLVRRLQLADGIKTLYALKERTLEVTDQDRNGDINIANDESMIRSLDRIGYLSLAAGATTDH